MATQTRFSLQRTVMTGAVALLAGVAGLVSFRFFRADIAAEVYRQRLDELAADYAALQGNYNDAVRRTAVTELIVQGRTLRVRVRTIAGPVREIETPFDPNGEVYVDYVVLDGRLWIRRVFDARTPPDRALVIDPEVDAVNWDDPNAAHGKAVYRRLGEGRWVVSVSGDGSLGLARAPAGDEPRLAAAPEIKDYSQAAKDADRRVNSIGLGEVLRRLFGGGGGTSRQGSAGGN